MDYNSIVVDLFSNSKAVLEVQANCLKAKSALKVRQQVFLELETYIKKRDGAAELVIVNLTDQPIKDLLLLEKAHQEGKPLVVIGNKRDVEVLATAINVGITRFIDQTNVAMELPDAIDKILHVRTQVNSKAKKRRINSIINAKGGSGASFIASNIAYKLSEFADQKVALLDFDLQFGTIGLNFDVTPKYTIAEALKSIGEIDSTSLDAYLVKYCDSLRLLLPSADEIVVPGEIELSAVQSLLNLLRTNYNHILIDLPRLIDPLSTTVFEQSEHIIIVVQQSLAQYRDGRRMVQILNKDLDIPLSKIVVAINRYNPKASLKRSDMVDLLNHNGVFTIENDFEGVAAAGNLGEPFCKKAPKAKISQDLTKLALYLSDADETKSQSGLIARLGRLFGKS